MATRGAERVHRPNRSRRSVHLPLHPRFGARNLILTDPPASLYLNEVGSRFHALRAAPAHEAVPRIRNRPSRVHHRIRQKSASHLPAAGASRARKKTAMTKIFPSDRLTRPRSGLTLEIDYRP